MAGDIFDSLKRAGKGALKGSVEGRAVANHAREIRDINRERDYHRKECVKELLRDLNIPGVGAENNSINLNGDVFRRVAHIIGKEINYLQKVVSREKKQGFGLNSAQAPHAIHDLSVIKDVLNGRLLVVKGRPSNSHEISASDVKALANKWSKQLRSRSDSLYGKASANDSMGSQGRGEEYSGKLRNGAKKVLSASILYGQMASELDAKERGGASVYTGLSRDEIRYIEDRKVEAVIDCEDPNINSHEDEAKLKKRAANFKLQEILKASGRL